MRLLIAAALTAACAWTIAQPSLASPPAPPRRPATIQVTGHAQVSKAPDRVYIDIGVMTQAKKSASAADANATRVSTVIAAVRRAAGSGAQLTTTQYSVSPNYNYPRDGGTPAVTGYTASNMVQVRLDDLHRVGQAIDAATQAGANNVQDIRFALRDEEAPRAEALQEAARNARQDAEALAAALGLRIVRVLAVGEQAPEIRPSPLYAQKLSLPAAPVRATPVEAGTIDIDATVTLTVEVAPAKR
jgi:uncharacterized protein